MIKGTFKSMHPIAAELANVGSEDISPPRCPG